MRILKNERGQTSLFMALFIFTMIIMFAFTTNIGMLVHAKINLQNAADAAAYAGAAVQARQLTAVGYLNWEMRRAIKEFEFYYTVRSQYAAMPCFPSDYNGQPRPGIGCPPNDGNARHDFRFFDPRENTNELGDNYLPSVCIIFDPTNNYCQKAGVPGIPEFQGGGSWGVADPIVRAVRDATNQIIEKKIADCLGRTEINAQFLIAWLFNLNPIQGADALLTIGRDSDDPFPYSDGLERVGILPRMSILRARVDNFEEALNLNLANEGVGSITISDDTMGVLRNAANGGGKTLDYFERPIQAYLSAKNNLPGVGGDNGIFANIEMTELVPNQPGAPTTGAGFDNSYIRNPPVLVKFKDEFAHVNLAFSKFETRGVLDRGDCFQYRSVNAIPHFPFGVSKYPGLITYYAVRLQAKARLLFSPFGGNGIVTLSAYSAAKPFGSRVGKDISFNTDTESHQMVANARMSDQDPFYGTFKGARFPNVLVADDDSDSETGGFTRNSHLGYLRGAMLAFDRLDYGPALAGAYAPWEVGYYTVPAQYNAPEQIGLFEDNPVYEGGETQFFTMAAPILPVNSNPGLGVLRLRVEEWLNGGPEDAPSLEGKYADFMQGVMSDAKWAVLFGYLQLHNETVNVSIPDPTLSANRNLLTYAQSFGQRYTVAGSPNYERRQMTSWNNQKTSADQDLGSGTAIPANSELGPDIGRSGYSVKFVSFRSLEAGGRGTNDPLMPDMQWSNPFPRLDAGGAKSRIEDDLNKIRH
ncbi:MAG: pilus assembly protein TadG-related protein [Bdellovibrionota bacterium]